MSSSVDRLLRENFGVETSRSGKSYFRSNKVVVVNIDLTKSTIGGYVDEEDGTRTSVAVTFLHCVGDRRVATASMCECQTKSYCKHAAALLYGCADKYPAEFKTMATHPDDKEQTPKTSATKLIDPSVMTWIQSLKISRSASATALMSVTYDIEMSNSKEKAECLVGVKIKPQGFKSGGLRHNPSLPLPDNVDLVDIQLIGKISPFPSNHVHGSSQKVLSGERGADLLEEIIATGRCFMNTLQLKTGPPLQAEGSWTLDKQAYRFDCKPLGMAALGSGLPLYLNSETGECGRFLPPAPFELIAALQAAPPLPMEALPALRQKLRELGVESEQVLPPALEVEVIEGEPKFSVKIRQKSILKGSQKKTGRTIPTCILTAHYGTKSIRLFSIKSYTEEEMFREVVNGKSVIYIRSRAAEEAALNLLWSVGFTSTFATSAMLTAQERNALGSGAIIYEPALLGSDQENDNAFLGFIKEGLPRLEAEGWDVQMDGIRFVPAEQVDWEITSTDQAEGWFEVELGITVEGKKYALLPILTSILGAHRYSTKEIDEIPDDSSIVIRLPDERLVDLPVWRFKPIVRALHQLFGQPSDWGAKLNVSRARLQELGALETSAKGAKFKWTEPESMSKLRRKLDGFKQVDLLASPKSLKGELRPYQSAGLSWLNFLQEFGFGGILADDMGLGKTVQTIAHILHEKERKRLKKPVLIVAPTSTIPNWTHEIGKFAPKLKLLVFHGSDRKAKLEGPSNHDVILTSYALLNRDKDALSKQPFHLVVLDEAQNIKNPATTIFKAAKTLNAGHRLCLSGTPVENNLDELWALFNFAMPGLFPGLTEFRKTFRSPIEKLGDNHAREMLARRIKPFLLRRTKEQVATELPPKTEILERVELESAQRDFYETIRVAMDARVRSLLAGKGLEKGRIEILDALLKLRQACCDPRLVKVEAAGQVQGSAKLERLTAMLEELISEGRRILVFSQFTSMLDLIEPVLKSKGIEWVRISGDTKDRQSPVAKFQSGEVPVFLISLRAGGVGLNLTAADVVIHYDPWWNPAVERQATDRAHRIGQDKTVFVYKLVAEGTVEEKILVLQARKAALAGAVLSSDENLVTTLTPDDLKWIFS